MRRFFVPNMCMAALGLLLTSCDQKPKSPYLEGSPPHYVNPHYGVDVAIPKGIDICVLGDGITISHGFVMPLTRDPECKAPNPYDLPHIRAYFDFGAVYDEHPPTITDMVNRECGDRLKPLEMPELIIPGHATAVCRGPDVSYGKDGKMLLPNGLIETALYTWAGDEHGTFFEISLATTDNRLPEDIQMLKRILQGVKLAQYKTE